MTIRVWRVLWFRSKDSCGGFLGRFGKAIVISIIACLVFSIDGFSQSDLKSKAHGSHRKRIQHLADSSWKRDLKLSDTSSVLLINRIEDINNTLNSSNDVLERGYDTMEISETLPRYKRNLDLIHYSIASLRGVSNLRNLSLLQDMVNDITDDLKDWQSSLLAYYTEVVGIHTQMRTLAEDSTLNNLPVDSSLRNLYVRQLSNLKFKWTATDTATQRIIVRIDRLQSEVSNQYFESNGLQLKIEQLIKAYQRKVFGNEFGSLWHTGGQMEQTSELKSHPWKDSFEQASKILQYYFWDNWQGRLAAVCFAIIFFVWTSLNWKRLIKSGRQTALNVKYVKPLPILSSLVFLFSLLPFFDLHPPVIIIELTQLLLACSITFLVFQRWPGSLFLLWVAFFLLLSYYFFTGILIQYSLGIRQVSFLVDLASFFLGWILIRRISKRETDLPGYMRGIAILFMLLSLTSAVCNLLGRYSLSQVLGSTALSSFVQAIGLTVFIQVVLDGIYLQLEADRKSSRFTAYLKYENVELRLRYALTFIAAIFWTVTLAENLNIYDMLFEWIQSFLNKEHQVGNTSFTIGSILVFFFIIWIANILQKYMGYFFGETEDDVLPERKSKLGTSILLIRLLILTAGFFLGILASGIPLDRVTIVLGAFGVGIGLGLQNIVNNLVSGVILAIERPIQVGDLVEINSNSGRVKDIGIRSTRLVTSDGAEVVIPNGDMLSQKLTNWTLSNPHARALLNIRVLDAVNVEETKARILSVFESEDKLVMLKPSPHILTRSIGPDGVELRVLFWVNDISNLEEVQGVLKEKISTACGKDKISILS